MLALSSSGHPCLSSALARPAAAASGWRSGPQEGLGHCGGGRRGGERARSGEKPGWQTAPAPPGLRPGGWPGRGDPSWRVTCHPSRPPLPQSAPEWLWAVGGHGGSTTGQVETPGSPSTRAGDLGEGHFSSGPFRLGLPWGVSVFHPAPPSAPCPVQPPPSCIRAPLRGCRNTRRTCVGLQAPACGHRCKISSLLYFAWPPPGTRHCG